MLGASLNSSSRDLTLEFGNPGQGRHVVVQQVVVHLYISKCEFALLHALRFAFIGAVYRA